MKAEAGDKVRLKKGGHKGERGIIKAVDAEGLSVQLDTSLRIVRVTQDAVTNLFFPQLPVSERLTGGG